MSKKQLGAVPVVEAAPDGGGRPGRFQRLRSQPGFRTAAVAFALTVALGAGSTIAYAYWSQSTPVSITGTTASRLPAPGSPVCTERLGANRLSWTPLPAGSAEIDAVYLLRFKRTDDQRSVTLAVPFPPDGGTPEVYPYNEHDVYDGLGRSTGSGLDVTVSTAIVSSTAKGIRRVMPAEILQESAQPSPPRTLRYSAGLTWITAAFGC